jgi:Alphavirus core protein
MDIEVIAPGEDFVKTLEDAVSSCDALIAIIGKQWLTITDDTKQRRLDNSDDFVRVEIATALDRNIRVIPALVQGATMPRQQDLPDALVKLARRNALEISDARWTHDVGRLIKTLEEVLNQRIVKNGGIVRRRAIPWLKIAAIVFAVIVLVTVGMWKLIPITTDNRNNANTITSDLKRPTPHNSAPSLGSTSPLVDEIGIQTVRVQSQSGISRCGFFTPKAYIVTVTSGLEHSTEVTVMWRSGNKDWRERAQVIKRGEIAPHATLLKLTETSIVGHKAPIRFSPSLQPGDQVERYLGTDDRRPGKVLDPRGQELFKFESGRTIVINLLVTTGIAVAGESGAPVVDTQGRIVAMVYGGNPSLNKTVSIVIEDIKNSFPEAF